MSGDEGKRKLTYANNCCANWSVDGKQQQLEGFLLASRSIVASLGGSHAALTHANQSSFVLSTHSSIFDLHIGRIFPGGLQNLPLFMEPSGAEWDRWEENSPVATSLG